MNDATGESIGAPRQADLKLPEPLVPPDDHWKDDAPGATGRRQTADECGPGYANALRRQH